MCLGGHYGYICQGEFSIDNNKAILTCGQLGYDPAGEEESTDTYMTHTHVQTFMLPYTIKVSDCLQGKLKQ